MPKGSKKTMVIKSISLPEPLWKKAINKADENAQSLSAVVRKFLELWVEDKLRVSDKSETNHQD